MHYLIHSVAQDPNFEAAFGMLYAEYRPEHFRWETIIMLRKLAMVIVVVFLGHINMDIQLLAALGLVLITGRRTAVPSCGVLLIICSTLIGLILLLEQAYIP